MPKRLNRIPVAIYTESILFTKRLVLFLFACPIKRMRLLANTRIPKRQYKSISWGDDVLTVKLIAMSKLAITKIKQWDVGTLIIQKKNEIYLKLIH